MLHDPEALLLLGMPEPQVAALLNGDTGLQVFDREAIAEDGVVLETPGGEYRAVRQCTGTVAIYQHADDVDAPATKDERVLDVNQSFRLPRKPSDGDEFVFINRVNRNAYFYTGEDDQSLTLGGNRGILFRAMAGRWYANA